jgi:hypothetical protein
LIFASRRWHRRRTTDEGGVWRRSLSTKGWRGSRQLKKRHEELIALRNENAHRERRFYGASADKELVKEPVYDIKVLDKSVTRVAREIRLLEQAMKSTNAKTAIEGYSQDDAALRRASRASCPDAALDPAMKSMRGLRRHIKMYILHA